MCVGRTLIVTGRAQVISYQNPFVRPLRSTDLSVESVESSASYPAWGRCCVPAECAACRHSTHQRQQQGDALRVSSFAGSVRGYFDDRSSDHQPEGNAEYPSSDDFSEDIVRESGHWTCHANRCCNAAGGEPYDPPNSGSCDRAEKNRDGFRAYRSFVVGLLFHAVRSFDVLTLRTRLDADLFHFAPWPHIVNLTEQPGTRPPE